METEPAFETRKEQPYVGKRVVMPMSAFAGRVPALTQELTKWLGEHGVRPPGESFLRYHVIDMPARMDVEVGFPVDEISQARDGVSTGTLPAGRYGTLTYTGIANGISANRRLVEWIADQGEEPDSRQTNEGYAFASRIEILLTDPAAQPDQGQWRTRVAIKIC